MRHYILFYQYSECDDDYSNQYLTGLGQAPHGIHFVLELPSALSLAVVISLVKHSTSDSSGLTAHV